MARNYWMECEAADREAAEIRFLEREDREAIEAADREVRDAAERAAEDLKPAFYAPFYAPDPVHAALNGWLNSQTIAQRAADADLDEVISLRLAGGSYRAIAQATGLTIARITRICREEAA